MKPFITSGSRAKCYGCGGTRFEKKKFREYVNEMPYCPTCRDWPTGFRVVFLSPVIGEDGFKKQFKERDNRDRKLDTPAKADAFCELVKELITIKGDDFDPRELGTKEDQKALIIKYNTERYLKEHRERLDTAKITPGGFAKKERVIRLYILPMFGEMSFRSLTYQVINRALLQSYVPKLPEEKKARKLTDSIRSETIKELKSFLRWAVIQGFLKSVPEIPRRPKENKFKAEDFYTIKERDMVINNVKNIKARIALSMLAVYTRRKCEILPLRWGKVNFKLEKFRIDCHVSDGKGVTETKILPGLKSSPDKILTFDFFPGLRQMLLELNPSLDPNEFVFKGKHGGMLPKNYLYDAWKESVLDLMNRKKLDKYCDMHRGTRSSTLSELRERGHSFDALGELYGGDDRTLKDFYVKRKSQNTQGLLTSDGLISDW